MSMFSFSLFCCAQVPKNQLIQPAASLCKPLNGPHKDRTTKQTLAGCLHCAASARQCVFEAAGCVSLSKKLIQDD